MQRGENKKRADKLLDVYCKEYKSVLFKYAYLRTGNNREAADDCVQEAYVIIYKRMLKGETFAQPKAFLYRTVDNLVKEYLREFKTKIKNHISLESEEAADISSVLYEYEGISRQDEENIVNIILSSLSDSDKVLYRSRYIEHLSVKDISERFGLSVSAVTTRLLRLRGKIGDKLEKELNERGIPHD